MIKNLLSNNNEEAIVNPKWDKTNEKHFSLLRIKEKIVLAFIC